MTQIVQRKQKKMIEEWFHIYIVLTFNGINVHIYVSLTVNGIKPTCIEQNVDDMINNAMGQNVDEEKKNDSGINVKLN